MCTIKFLYKITNGLGNFYVVAEDINSAVALLTNVLGKTDYGFSDYRIITNIEIIAAEDFYYNNERRLNVDPYKPLLIQEKSEHE